MSCSPEWLLPILHGVSEFSLAEDGSYLLNRVPRRLHRELNNDIVTRAASPAGTEFRFRLNRGRVRRSVDKARAAVFQRVGQGR